MNAANARIVSFDDEPLILVDSDDNVTGHMPKAEAHVGEGVLHRAFSIFLFNDAGDVLMQQRADEKMLWGGFWSNSVCSHPRRGEAVADAARRRLSEEIDVDADVHFLYKFEYHAQFGEIGAEHEMCSVFFARSNAPVAGNPTEIADFAFMPPDALDAALIDEPARYTPWLKMEWPRIRADHWDRIAATIAA
ncbi:isopentenyl-diphosphate Delta-isomerase [Salinisphaera sp. Q1T1-3]|uniref:isopentenyl-diphosphate Delta-isomerase n=1 Tax=Salinisphaera sp. Q1T1-3 TaxID=2321229 RepID=UPI000E754BA4|nr:isopentenyl-diphosphate Delta-isomerase [Salinisphaera sp. Q1T1-3]RJS93955.1 isopentenyl-diphosphate Delta-isomerase [Salinisphaera sp. Q1T1-3]